MTLTFSLSLSALVQGFLMSLSLIAVLGPQNLYVLRHGILGTHTFLVTTTCWLSDVVLICLGTMGLGSFIVQVPKLRSFAIWGGIIFLILFATRSIYKGIKARPFIAQAEAVEAAMHPGSVLLAILGAIALSLLNPGVLLDTIVLLGTMGAQYDLDTDRISFTIGACLASLIWFFVLAYGARLIRPLFSTQGASRFLDLATGVIMLVLAVMLAKFELTG